MNTQKLMVMLAVALLALAGLTVLFASTPSSSEVIMEDVRGLFAPRWQVNSYDLPGERSHGEKLVEKSRFFWNGGGVSDLKSHDGNIWLADHSAQQIFQLSDAGRIITTVSHEGEAPWEHQGLNQISFRSDSLFSFDNLTMRLRGFSTDGQFGGYRETSGMFITGTTLSSDHAILLESDIETGLSFVTINRKAGTVLRQMNISELLEGSENILHPDVAFQGQLIPIEKGGAYFYCLKAGIIIRFDESGSPIFVNSTIDAKLPPTVTVRSSGDFLIYQEEPSYTSNLSAAGSAEELLILSNLRFSQGNVKRIDIYEGETGRYLHSMEVPSLEDNILPVKIETDGDKKLIVLYEDQSLVTYTRQALMP